MAEETSIKQLIQKMIDGQMQEVLLGTVILENPLKIQIEGDAKWIITENNTIIPWQLTDYETEITFDDPNIKQVFTTWDMSETLESLESKISFKEPKTVKHKITVRNKLVKGEKVYVLSFHHGKQYYVLDRVKTRIER